MMREVIGAIMSCVMGLFLLWFILPMLNVTYTQTKATVNATDPTMQALFSIGDGIYSIMPFVIFIVVGYLIFAYATRREPFDTR